MDCILLGYESLFSFFENLKYENQTKIFFKEKYSFDYFRLARGLCSTKQINM